jgi:hypothetical protein
LLFGISSTQNANSTLAFSYINSANANIAYHQSVINNQNNNIQSAWNLANTALQNTTGTFAGSLTFTGDITANNLYGVSQLEFINNGLIRTFNRSGGQKDINILAGSDLGTGNGGSITIISGTTPAPGYSGGNINLVANGNNSSVIVTSNNFVVAGSLSTTGPITTGNLIVNGTTTLNGTANISGLVNMNAQVILTNTSFSNTQSALTITATPTVTTPSQDGYMLHISGKQNVSSRIVTDSFGANTYVVYAGRSARGNVTYPSALQTNDVLSRFSGNGYGTTRYQPFGTARIDFVAAENYTDTSTGSQIQFWNCPVGTNTITQIATFNGTSVTFTGYVQPQKGFIYTPLVYPSSQTAITIDMANNSLVRAQTSSGLVVTLSSLLAGKEVVAWITNTAGPNQTFTHGVSATNSTTNSTTYAIPGTSTILVRYMSIDGTLQNTFVAITHA